MSEPQLPTANNPSVLIPVNPAIEAYQHGLLHPTDHPVLADMEALAEKNNFPIVGRLVGAFLATQAKMIGAKRVFEFGSGYGYSAYWFAQAVGAQGQVICSEADFLNQEKAQMYLSTAGLWDRIEFKVGMAQEQFAKPKACLTFAITMSTKATTPTSGKWPKTVSAQADCTLPTMSYGAGG